MVDRIIISNFVKIKIKVQNISCQDQEGRPYYDRMLIAFDKYYYDKHGTIMR
jgi:hypothetical protein